MWIAGAKAPAFIERSMQGVSLHQPPDSRRIAGAKAPAFIERRWTTQTSVRSTRSTDCGGEGPRLH